MLLTCWSPKGGAGTTVVAAALALVLARARPGDDPGAGGALVVDLAGDLPVVLGVGVGATAGPGLAHWLAAAPDVPADAIGRIEVPVTDGLALVPRGDGPFEAGPGAADLLASVLAAERRPVVVDCGRIDADTGAGADVASTLVLAATRSLLVLRPCFLAVRRATVAALRAHGIVLLDEPGRALAAADVETATGVRVVARVRVTDKIARAVDAGLLTTRLPRTLAEDLHGAA